MRWRAASRLAGAWVLAGCAGIAGGGRPRPGCTAPMFSTSEPNGGRWIDGYYVHNNMWNHDVPLGPQTISACSPHDWFVVSDQADQAGAVKTYPNVHKDYDRVPLASFHFIRSTFAETSPHVGIYDVAYDIWLNGVATPESTEIMVWNENYHQVPSGPAVARVALGGRSYDVHTASGNHYIAFVPLVPFASGTVDLLEIIEWTVTRGWLPPGSTLGAIDLGVEIVSTGGAPATFQFSDVSIDAR